MAYVKGQPFKPAFFDVDGEPLVLGTIDFEIWNTTTPTPFYTDSIGTPGGTSLTLDLLGQPDGVDIFYDDTIEYKFVVKDRFGSVIDTLGPYIPYIAAKSLAEAGDDTGSELVGFIQAGTGAVARTSQDKMRESVTSFDHATEAGTQAAAVAAQTGGFWADQLPRPNIRRVPGRLFVGDGVAASGNENFPGADQSWLYDSFGAYWLERGSQLFVLPEDDGYIAGMFATRTSTADPVGSVAIGMASIGWNDDTGGAMLSWAGYFEASREAGAGVAYGLEIVGKNKGSNHIRNPYAQDSSGILGVFFAGGGDPAYNGASANPNNAALVIGSNSNTWNTGIIFDADAITGTDGVTGTGHAIKMAKGHLISWFCDTTNLGAQIVSTVTAGANKNKKLDFSDTSVFLGTDAAGSLFNFSIPASAVNGFQFSSTAAAAGSVALSASGADTNIDIQLAPKGTGILKFGSYVAGAPASTGYIFFKTDDGVVRKLLVG